MEISGIKYTQFSQLSRIYLFTKWKNVWSLSIWVLCSWHKMMNWPNEILLSGSWKYYDERGRKKEDTVRAVPYTDVGS